MFLYKEGRGRCLLRLNYQKTKQQNINIQLQDIQYGVYSLQDEYCA